jgi:RimJ/RimL family protein N-acetyltransferase
VTSAPEAVELSNDVVRLTPASTDDAAELFAALSDERVWAMGYGGGPAGRWADVDAARAWLASADRGITGPRQCWVARLATDSDLGAAGTVVGTSSLAEWDLVHERVHLGWTAYGPSWWAGPVNPACKLALLGYAFDELGFGRVKLQTDLVNDRSQAAIAKLGATREGVLRRHIRRADGSWRDSVVFSILGEEWPAVKARLEERTSLRS